MGKISDALKKVSQVREKQRQARPESVLELPSQDKNLLPSTAEKKTAIFDPLTLAEKLGFREKLFITGEKDSSGIDPRVVTYYDYSSIVSEQYRTLRTSIKTAFKKFKTTDKTKAVSSPCIFTITSALHSEGKTLTAVNLAVALAHELESKVLLLDCDFRKGSVHKFLNLNSEAGLSDVLTEGIDISNVIIKSKINNLSVIPGGKPLFNPSEFLGSKRMRRVIETLKALDFTHIILDTPPLFPFIDGGILGEQTQGAFMVVQANRAQSSVIEKAKAALGQAHSKFLGFILTQAESFAPSAYGYKYYYHHANKK